jgi:hypothetical protein
MWKPIAFSRFGGLILNKPSDEVGGDAAIDLLDVVWDGATGRLRSRHGAKKFTVDETPENANYQNLFPHSDTRLIARRAGLMVAISLTTGKEVAEIGVPLPLLANSFAHLGTPTASYTYIADQQEPLKRYDGTEFKVPTATVDEVAGKAMPKGLFVAGWPDGDNRLVVAGTTANGGPNGAVSSGSHVWFSMPGDAESYESTSYVQVSPGDGESIVGCCTWGGMVFVFKETRLFIFYGVSADEEGRPVFNFRTVELGTRILAPASFMGSQVVSARDGVYFVSNEGVWVTTGGEPSLLSEDLDPLADTAALIGPAATTFGEARWTEARGIEVSDDALYVGLMGEVKEGAEKATIITRLLKLDLRTMNWTVWNVQLNGMAAWNQDTATHRKRLYFSYGGLVDIDGIYYFTDETNEDPTATIEPRWQSGFYGLENADEKTFVNAKMWGSGEVSLKVAEDFGSLGAATTFKLGTAPAIAQRQQKKTQTATLFSHQFSGTGPWVVQRLDRYLRETRVPGTQKKK